MRHEQIDPPTASGMELFNLDPTAILTGAGSMQNALLIQQISRAIASGQTDGAAACCCCCKAPYEGSRFPTVGVRVPISGANGALYASVCSKCTQGRGRKAILGLVAKTLDIDLTDAKVVTTPGPETAQ
ncbi:hypothetical protein CLV78_10211 [Aliiruegeria haliotis]|uniref:Uncharacterized protein n=1 Tax=Aliiruegeria haliotis TaxID=1280846 RepID=A0A2T0RUI9_9RHOB|nr:hypothetical protein [Aliiruegeria haliotis]PRY24841.1 hypothetical protein CLV78_10211 [Aliiruegeria haliotis]